MMGAGGVTKEFFQLLIAQLFDPCYGMFSLTDSRCVVLRCVASVRRGRRVA